MSPDRGIATDHDTIIVHEVRCAYCGACVAVCPANAISLSDVTLRIDDEACTACLQCIRICPLGALEGPDGD
jgi:ferredoxin